LYFIFISFKSQRVDAAINVEKNFKKDWDNEGKKRFLSFQYEIMKNNQESQSKLLKKISRYTACSMIFFGVIIFIFLLHSIYMTQNKDSDDNLMKPILVEEVVNPMVPTKVEKSVNSMNSEKVEFSTHKIDASSNDKK